MSPSVAWKHRLSGVLLVLVATGCGREAPPTSPSPDPIEPIGVRADALVTDDLLASEIEALVREGALNRGQAKALLQKLDNARRHADAGRMKPAEASLEALVEQVGDFVEDGVLTAEQGEELTEGVEDVRQAFGGGFVDVSNGAAHTCGVKGTGEVYCWGDAGAGKLGDGATTDRESPVRVSSSETFVAVVAGWEHTCGLTTQGDAYCWGWNGDGQLGDGTKVSSSTPVGVTGGITFTELDASFAQTCGLAEDGTVYCWGNDGAEQLGVETSDDDCVQLGTCSAVPLPVAGSYVSVSTGLVSTCALGADGDASCWGRNWGSFGNGEGPVVDEPTPAAAYPGYVLEALSHGGVHSCALDAEGQAVCSGFNTAGMLGDGTSGGIQTTPTSVMTGASFVEIVASDANTSLSHTCAIAEKGDAYCWGANDTGQLGTASSETCSTGSGSTFPCSTTPEEVSGGHAFADLDLAGGTFSDGSHTCGVTTGGELYCWGANNVGQLGDGTTTDRSSPTRVAVP